MAKSNSKHEQYAQRTEEFLRELQKSMDFEIVDVEFVREAGMWYLRAYCDMEGGIGVDDCADISRKVSDWLDREDFIPENYILEISSPGLGRQLKKDRDLVRENGQEGQGSSGTPRKVRRGEKPQMGRQAHGRGLQGL